MASKASTHNNQTADADELNLVLDSDHLEKDVLTEGMLLDYITGLPVKSTPKEEVRQRIARALFHEYGIAVDDMAPDFPLRVDGRRRKIDIAIFGPGQTHTEENLRRIVICDKEPKAGKSVYKMRDHDQAKREFDLLHAAMATADHCDYGLWTNGLEFFFFKRQLTRFDVRFQPLGDWPLADETQGARDVFSEAFLRRAEPAMLRTAFRRCHNFIHGNEGMPKDAAFWQFLYLIFAKLHDEKVQRTGRRSGPPRFWAPPNVLFEPTEQRKLRTERIDPLFSEVKQHYHSIFRGNEEISLSDRALAFMVAELAKYDFSRTGMDAKGAAYQEIVGANLRGDRGQYFTPRGAIKLMVEMLDPKPHERLLDPACGTGGFLVGALDHLNRVLRDARAIDPADESTEDFLSLQDALAGYVTHNLFGADFDPFLVRAAQMNVVMSGSAEANLFHMNSLEFPAGHLAGIEPARRNAPLGSMDVIMTNPPFGSDIPITDINLLQPYELAHIWERAADGFRNTGRLQGSVAPEILFIERCIQWLKPGGRIGIVLPDGILGNPGDEYIRWWILRHCWVLASVDLPVEVFIVEANVNILTSLLFLKKKPREVLAAEALGQQADYPVFMAVAENVGFDRRGNTLYRRRPDGEEILEETVKVERVRIGDRVIERTLRRKDRIVDDDLPPIAAAYADFRRTHPEPGR
jgi:type I restriction enzyme M protein